MSGKYKEKLDELHVNLQKNRPDMLFALIKAAIAGMIIFTFLAGFIFTVIPLSINVYNHIELHLIAPMNEWFAEEPIFGHHMLLVIQVACVLVFLFFIKGYVQYLWVYVLHVFEGWFSGSKKQQVHTPPAKTSTKTTGTVERTTKRRTGVQ